MHDPCAREAALREIERIADACAHTAITPIRMASKAIQPVWGIKASFSPRKVDNVVTQERMWRMPKAIVHAAEASY